jgi:hypothetical protein
VQSAASDARAAKEFADTETILDRLDVNTAGGISDVLDAIHAIGNPTGASEGWRPTFRVIRPGRSSAVSDSMRRRSPLLGR